MFGSQFMIYIVWSHLYPSIKNSFYCTDEEDEDDEDDDELVTKFWCGKTTFDRHLVDK